MSYTSGAEWKRSELWTLAKLAREGESIATIAKRIGRNEDSVRGAARYHRIRLACSRHRYCAKEMETIREMLRMRMPRERMASRLGVSAKSLECFLGRHRELREE